MTDISRLKVSLTKHNAHKVSSLLKKYRASQILDNLDEVHAEEAQAHKNLSVQSGNNVPGLRERQWVESASVGVKFSC